MRKADLVNIVSEKTEKTGVPKVDVLVSIEAFLKEIKESLEKGEEVFIRGFGSFIVTHRKEKKGRNIKKGETIIIPAHNIPDFRPSEIFKEMIKSSKNIKKKK